MSTTSGLEPLAELEPVDPSCPLTADEGALDRLRILLDIPDRPVQRPADMALAKSSLAMSIVAFRFENPYHYAGFVLTALCLVSLGFAVSASIEAKSKRRTHKYLRVVWGMSLTAMLLNSVGPNSALSFIAALL